MTSINTNYLHNNLPLTNQNSNPYATSKISIPGISHKLNPPGITNILFAPLEFVDNVIDALAASRIQDNEGMVLNGLRVASTPASFIGSSLQLGWVLLQVGVFCKIFSSTVLDSFASVSKAIPLIGFAICAVEGLIESLGIHRTLEFKRRFYLTDLESLKTALQSNDKNKIALYLNRIASTLPDALKQSLKECELSPEILRKLEENIYLNRLELLNKEYLQVSPESAKKIDHVIQNKFTHLSVAEQEKKREIFNDRELIKKNRYLVRRVQVELANEIQKTLPEAIAGLQSPDLEKRKSSLETSSKLFEKIKTQHYKNLLVHALGLFALAIAVTGLIAGMIGCPFAVLIPLIAIGMGTSLLRNILGKGFIEAEGWNFEFRRCIPQLFILTYKKLTEKKVQLPRVYSIPPLYLDLEKLNARPVKNGIDYTLYRG